MKTKAFRLCAITLALYLIVGIAFYFLAGDSLFFTSETTMGVSGYSDVAELTQSFGDLTQPFVCEYDSLNCVVVTPRTYGRANTGTVKAEILDSNGNAIRTVYIDVSHFSDNDDYDIYFEEVKNAKGQTFALRLTSDCNYGSAVTFLHGNSIDAGRASIATNITEALALRRKVKEIDPHSFIIITKTSEIMGKGFRDV